MNGPRFFTAPRKGENFELRADLNSEYRDRRKDAIKRVIANMTVGKDVSGLFPDVLKNMQTEDLEQKKLVYLYLMNYAKTQPELVILAVNTFVKVSKVFETARRHVLTTTSNCRMPMIPIPWFELLRYGRCHAFERRKSSTTFLTHCKSV